MANCYTQKTSDPNNPVSIEFHKMLYVSQQDYISSFELESNNNRRIIEYALCGCVRYMCKGMIL